MVGLNSLLEVARRAINTHQFGLNVVGNNIANASRPEYSRQRMETAPSATITLAEGSIGTGVKVTGVYRMRDMFIDYKLRQEYSLLGRWSYRENIMSQIDSVVNEPSDNGLGYLMNQFWDGWQELVNNPESGTARSVLRQRAESLTDRFQNLDETLRTYQNTMNTDLIGYVKEINNLTQAIADLNQKIRNVGDANNRPNDLLDMRDHYIDELSKYVDVEYYETPNNSVAVIMNGKTLVDGADVNRISTEARLVDGHPMQTLVWENGHQELTVSDGSVKGLLEVRDEEIPAMLDKLDTLALSLVEQINSVHATGYTLDGKTNVRFFDENTTGASDFSLSNSVLTDVNNIAAGATDSPGDNAIALAIAGLRDQNVLSDGTQTFDQYYNSIISELGLVTQEAQFASDTQNKVVQQVENKKQETSGVSLDEEMVDLIKLQTAYQAATKVVNTANDLMDVLMNMV
ncbi:flagellar hook-associated protein FlgK [candidate division KSB1 bacterium]|nr:flagellar hook-associated protein FlgK [candidate division KSB1 bacterium]